MSLADTDREVYLQRFTADYITQLCTLNHIDINAVKTKQDRIKGLCGLPNMKEPVAPSVQPDLGQILEKLESIRKNETEALCQSLLQAMTAATKSSISAIRVGPELPDFHKFSSDDDITCYLSTFERMATAANKTKDQWPRLLEPYLTGKAQKAFHALSEEDKKQYDKIVQIILRHFQLTPEAYRIKFRTASKGPEETFEEFSTRLELYFRRWLEPKEDMSGSSDFKRMMHLIVIDQFLSSITNDNFRTKLREKKATSVQAVARIADEHVLNRKAETSGKPFPTARNYSTQSSSTEKRQETKSEDSNQSRSTGANTTAKRMGRFEAVCFRCHQLGHKVADCPFPAPNRADARSTSSAKPIVEVRQSIGRSTDKPLKPTDGSRVSLIKSPVHHESDDDTSGPYIIARVHGHDVKALLDTGSAMSLIDADLCETLGLAVTPESSIGPLTTVDGSQFHTSGIAAEAIAVAGVDVDISLHQVKKLPTPVLLGNDFARKANLVIDFVHNTYWLETSPTEPHIKWPLLGLKTDNYPPDDVTSVSLPVLADQADEGMDPGLTEDETLEVEQLLEEFPDLSWFD